MPVTVISNIKQQNRSNTIDTPDFFFLLDSSDINFTVQGIQEDSGFDPGTTPDNRYIIRKVNDLHPGFTGTTSDWGDNDILYYVPPVADNPGYYDILLDASNKQKGVIVFNEGDSKFYGFDGTEWLEIGSGSVGATGVQGFQGFQGPAGSGEGSGSQGFQGFQGNIGITGSQGFQGFQGNIGITGVQGFQGFQGVPGVGENGKDGVTGAQGFQGLQGFQGFQGFQGLKGSGKYFYGPTAPDSSDEGLTMGSKWFNTNVGAEFTYIIEGDDTTQWVMVNVFSATGPQGPAGTGEGSGSQGFQGFQGPAGSGEGSGSQGFQGFQGNIGTIGSIGDGTTFIDGNDQLNFIGGTGLATNVQSISSIPTVTISEIGWQRGGEVFPQTVGGVAAGTSFGQGTSINTILETLLFPYQPVSLSNFNIGFPKEVYEVGETAGNGGYTASWNFSGPNSNWIENSMYISASDNIGVIFSGFNYDDTPRTVSHSAYKYNAEKTLTFTITGDQEEGSNPSSSDPIYWRYKYFHGKTGANFDGTNLLNQGFTETLDKNRTSPLGWNITFEEGENYLYVIFPSSEYAGSIRFRDNNSGLFWPFKSTQVTFTHTNEHGISIVYKIYESSTETSAAPDLTIEANN